MLHTVKRFCVLYPCHFVPSCVPS